MPAFLIPWLIRGAMVLAVLAAIYAAWWKVEHWCNAACREQTERALLAENAIEAAQARATHLALLWAKAIDQVKTVYVEKVVIRENRVASLRERAGRINSDALVPLDVPTVIVLRDAAALANGIEDSTAAEGDSGASAAVPESTRDTTIKEWAEFTVEAAAAYADAREKHQACVAWANSISASVADAPAATP